MKGKKGTSFLVIGIVFFVAMTIMYVSTAMIVEKIRLEDYAGEEALALTQMEQVSYNQAFFLETALREFIKEETHNQNYATKIIENSLMKTINKDNKNYIILEEDSNQYYSKAQNIYYSLLSNNFNHFIVPIISKYNDLVIKNYETSIKRVDREYQFNAIKPTIVGLKFNIVSTNNDIYAFADKPTRVKSDKGEYYNIINMHIENYNDPFKKQFKDIINMILDIKACTKVNDTKTCDELASTKHIMTEDQLTIKSKINSETKLEEIEIFYNKNYLPYYVKYEQIIRTIG